ANTNSAESIQLIYHGQPYLVYPAAYLPKPRSIRQPSNLGLPYRNIEVMTSDNVRLRCFLIEYPPSKATVLMFHGNGMDHSDLLYHARYYFRYGCNVVTVSYRGYGDSEGVPSEKGLQRDAQAIVDWVRNDPGLSKIPIIVYGLSLGGAVAIDVTSKNPEKIKGLILENTFTSIPDVVHAWPIIGPFSFACTQRWNSASKLPKIPSSLPILFCSGRNDGVVPPVHMDNLWKIAQERGKIALSRGRSGGTGREEDGDDDGRTGEVEEVLMEEWDPPGGDVFQSYTRGGHVDTCTQPGYWPAIETFINKAVAS
ncbi:Protein bem46, partial [Leucoagaricus sp. SymC.cos]